MGLPSVKSVRKATSPMPATTRHACRVIEAATSRMMVQQAARHAIWAHKIEPHRLPTNSQCGPAHTMSDRKPQWHRHVPSGLISPSRVEHVLLVPRSLPVAMALGCVVSAMLVDISHLVCRRPRPSTAKCAPRAAAAVGTQLLRRSLLRRVSGVFRVSPLPSTSAQGVVIRQLVRVVTLVHRRVYQATMVLVSWQD
jgi:hypothetical protein